MSDSTMRAIDSICDDLAKVTPESIEEVPIPTAKELRKRGNVIKDFCAEVATWKLSAAEKREFDASNEGGGFLLIRGAERNLDTIVNHIHIQFITKD